MLTIPGREPNLFSLGPVQPRSADRAFPLAHLYAPALDRATWRGYVREQGKGEGGVMCLEDPRGYVHGLFAWSARRSLPSRRVLMIRDLILLHLPGKALQTAMIDAIGEFARTKSCQSIVMGVEERRPSVRSDVLEAHGFKPLDEKTFTVEIETA